MAGIELQGVTKVYANGVVAVNGVDLAIGEGEFMVLVGPSGCGKSTLLRMIAGLEEVSEGSVHIGDRDVTALAPRARDIAMVFQDYALYPHMTVRDNLAFGLKLRRVNRREIARRVEAVAATLGLQDYLKRRPAALSGGQRQRVAIGRAMVREPKAFLMDEPLSNLDAKLRVTMRAGARAAARAARRDDRLRHPRPDRGDDARPAGGRDPRRVDPAVRHAAGAVRPAGEPVRRGLHRLAGDEPGGRGRRRRHGPVRRHRPAAARGRARCAASAAT